MGVGEQGALARAPSRRSWTGLEPSRFGSVWRGAGIRPGERVVFAMEERIQLVQQKVGHQFQNPEHLARALTHASIASARVESNERLEFLGDSVLGLVSCELIYTRFPELLEGEMTKIKSAVVSRQTCAAIAAQLRLEEALLLGKGMMTGSELPSSLLAAALEAVVAAIYLDAGFEAAARFLRPLVMPHIEMVARNGHQQNFKSVLQQHAQQTMGSTPIYRVLEEKGPDHSKAFRIAVELGSRRFEAAWGASKKRAEQAAALLALRELGLVEAGEGEEVRVIGPTAGA